MIQSERFDSNSAAVQKGGAASLINIQKDIDTLVKSTGRGITQADLRSDLQATGLSPGDADNYAKSLIAAATSENTGELQNELATIFFKQGGVDKEYAQGLANTFLSKVATSSDTVYTYQNASQATDAAFYANTPGLAPNVTPLGAIPWSSSANTAILGSPV